MRNEFLPADKHKTIQFDQGPFLAENNPLKITGGEVHPLLPKKATKPAHMGETSTQQRDSHPAPLPPSLELYDAIPAQLRKLLV